MNWIDIRVRKPTKADASPLGRVLASFENGEVGTCFWGNLVSGDVCCVAWMPLSDLPKFVPIPDPPEGYRFKQEGDAFDRAVAWYWSISKQQWVKCSDNYGVFFCNDIYAVPVDPPKPRYRPFANAAEFEPYRDKWWRYKTDPADRNRRPYDFDDDGHCSEGWDKSLSLKVFADGTPFGIEVTE
jgi:hypothetical protein